MVYAGDTMTIRWRARSVTVAGIALSYSTDGGKNYTALGAALSAADTLFRWCVPVVESDSCIIRVADTDGNPSALSGVFGIRKKPAIAFGSGMLLFTVEQGKSSLQNLSIGNTGSGDLRVNAAIAQQIKRVVINELSIGVDTDAPDGIELFNSGVDVDLSGWQLSWEDNKTTSGAYTFPDGFILRGKTAYVVDDVAHTTPDSAAFAGMALQWNFSQGLELAVTLSDAAGRGVDFVKSSGSAVMPPEGTNWRGNGIALCSAFVARTSATDLDSAGDWSCTSKGTLKRSNSTQILQSGAVLIFIAPATRNVQAGQSVTLSVMLDASSFAEGVYDDTLIVYHNDPSKPSPLRVPCAITVKSPSSVITRRLTAASMSTTDEAPFIAAPNPVDPGERVWFQYRPTGSERSGELAVYNSVGALLHTERISFSGVNVFSRQMQLFSWQPVAPNRSVIRGGTCLARLAVVDRNGKRSLYSAKVGLK